MDGIDSATSFVGETAERYDDDDLRGDEDETVDFLAGLAGLAGSRPVLELAIGTGRVAVRLAARGVEVPCRAPMRRAATTGSSSSSSTRSTTC